MILVNRRCVYTRRWPSFFLAEQRDMMRRAKGPHSLAKPLAETPRCILLSVI